jgi:hypothetical protein
MVARLVEAGVSGAAQQKLHAMHADLALRVKVLL